MRRRRRADVGVAVGGALAMLLAAVLAGCARPVDGPAGYAPRADPSAARTAPSRAEAPVANPPRTAPDGPASPDYPVPTQATPPGGPTTGRPSTRPSTPGRPTPPARPSTAPGSDHPPLASYTQFSVCLSIYSDIRPPNAAFRRLPRHASLTARRSVAHSYDQAYLAMVDTLHRTELSHRDRVWEYAAAVAGAAHQLARSLPTGRGVSNEALRTAFVRLSEVCSR